MSITRDLAVNMGVTGLTGALGYRVLSSAGATLIARTITGVSEVPAGSGAYHVEVTTWNPAWIGRVIWDDGATTPGHVAEESFDAIQTGGGGSGGTVGSGADSCTMTITDSGTSLAIPDADVWISSDAAGTAIVAGTLQTNSLGKVTFLLDAGVTYYLWCQKDGENPIRGTSFVAVAD